MARGKRNIWQFPTKVLRLNADIALFLSASFVCLLGLAIWDFRYLANFTNLYRLSCCMIIFSFILNSAGINGDKSIRYLAPSFVFIAVFETAYALVQADPLRRGGSLRSRCASPRFGSSPSPASSCHRRRGRT
jgi:hypothetical protein